MATIRTDPIPKRKTVGHKAAVGWRSALTGSVGGLLLFELVSGLLIYLAPFSEYSQFSALLHSLIGVAMLAPIIWYVVGHWRQRKKGAFNHFKLLGYISLAGMVICMASGFVLTWQGLFDSRISYAWSKVHLVSGVGVAALLLAHLVIASIKKFQNDGGEVLNARRRFYLWSFGGSILLMFVAMVWTVLYQEPPLQAAFPDDYNWRFGEDRPFAPSMARLDYSDIEGELRREIVSVVGQAASDLLEPTKHGVTQQGGLLNQVRQRVATFALSPAQASRIDAALAGATTSLKQSGAVTTAALSGSARCGSSGCHSQIYEEWLPSAHRYSSLDDMFQMVQTLMVEETAPEYTR